MIAGHLQFGVEQNEFVSMTDTSFFETNLQAMRQRSPEQAETIAQLTPRVKERLYPLESLTDGFFNITFHTQRTIQSIFRSRNPKQEIDTWIQSSPLGKEQDHAVILLGFGLGYYAKEILKKLPSHGILAIVDPDPMVFFTAFYHLDLCELIQHPGVYFYIGQKIDKVVESLGSELQWSRFLVLPYHLLVHPVMRRLRPEYPTEFAATWRNALQRELMYRNSRISHSASVGFNTLSNAQSIVRFPGVNSLFDEFPKRAAVLISPGPSLEKELLSLQKVQNYVLITCVNTAYPILRKHGVRPHIVFTMDHEDRNLQSFNEAKPSPETFLIADPRIHSGIIRHFQPNVFLASWRTTMETIGEPQPLDQLHVPKMSGNAIYLWLQSYTGSKGDVYGPGSVAVVAFHILARMGCEPIILVGQDLAFCGEKNYADGTIFDNKNLPQDSDAAHLVPSVEGGIVATSETLNLYRQLLEHEIARFERPVINTSSGAVIKGAITSRLSSLWPKIQHTAMDYPKQLRALHQNYQPRMDLIDLRQLLYDALEKVQAFYHAAIQGLNLLSPEDLDDLTMEEKQSLLRALDEAITRCSKQHQQAFELLNELLQEAHFEYEDSRWRILLLNNEEEIINEKLRSRCRVLDAFARQAGILASLMEEKMAELKP